MNITVPMDAWVENMTFGGGGSVIILPGNERSGVTIASFAISTIGLALSSAAMTFLLLTNIFFEQWRQNYKNQLLQQFIFARFIYVLTRYVFDANLVFGLDKQRNTFLYYYDMTLLLYTEIALVVWMLVFTKQMYDSLVKVIYVRENHKVLRTSLLAWSLPLVPVTIMCAIAYFRLRLPVQIFLGYFFLVKWPIVVANAVLLVIILKTILERSKKRNESSVKIIIIMSLMILFFVIQQFVHDVYEIIYVLMFYKNDDVYNSVKMFLIILNIVSLYQCPISAFFWLYGNPNTRELWKFNKKTKDFEASVSDNRRSRISSTPA